MKLYLDTSVFGGYYDSEFAEFSKLLFSEIINEKHEIVISNITIKELQTAPTSVKKVLSTIPSKCIELVSIDEEIEELSKKYIIEEVISKKYITDALHIAIATINRVDTLVSWNFKHMVNINRIRQYNSVNLKYGYSIIDIRTPKEVINENQII